MARVAAFDAGVPQAMPQFSVVLARRVDRFIEAADLDEIGFPRRGVAATPASGRDVDGIEGERERCSRKQFDELAREGLANRA